MAIKNPINAVKVVGMCNEYIPTVMAGLAGRFVPCFIITIGGRFTFAVIRYISPQNSGTWKSFKRIHESRTILMYSFNNLFYNAKIHSYEVE